MRSGLLHAPTRFLIAMPFVILIHTEAKSDFGEELFKLSGSGADFGLLVAVDGNTVLPGTVGRVGRHQMHLKLAIVDLDWLYE